MMKIKWAPVYICGLAFGVRANTGQVFYYFGKSVTIIRRNYLLDTIIPTFFFSLEGLVFGMNNEMPSTYKQWESFFKHTNLKVISHRCQKHVVLNWIHHATTEFIYVCFVLIFLIREVGWGGQASISRLGLASP